MANKNNEVIGLEELSIYDALIKHYINLNYPKTNSNQIDDLFPVEPDPAEPANPDPINPDPVEPDNPDPVQPAVLPNASFGDATEEQFATIINGYYNRDFTLNQIQSIWHVGDTRSIDISAISSETVGESHPARTVTIQILGFGTAQKGNSLATSINGIEKALMTVDLKDCYCNTSLYYDTNTINEYGYINSTSDGTITWENCARRVWCNNDFYNALPLYIKNLIKIINHTSSIATYNSSTYKYTYSSTETQDKIFLHGEYEVNAADTGYIYELYKWENKDRRIKQPYRSDGLGAQWWTRDSVSEYSKTYFKYISNDGVNSNKNYADLSLGIVPVWCM